MKIMSHEPTPSHSRSSSCEATETVKCPLTLVAVLKDEVYRDIELVPMICGEIIDNKKTSNLVRQLNVLHPLTDFLHLKRVKAGGAGNLQLLISVLNTEEDQQEQLSIEQSLLQRQSTVGLGRLSVVHVPRFKPITRKQYEEAISHWPTHFHEDKRLEKALKGELFNDKELTQLRGHMEAALQEATLAGQPAVGAVMVDPVTNRVVARAQSQSSSHPLKHAVMVCIDTVARQQGGGAWSDNRPSLLQQTITPEGKPAEGTEATVGPEGDGLPATKRPRKDGQYLCTGYDLYTTQEPCVMCAMALVHSRVGRVFYGCASPHTGGLGSQYKIHTHQAINHHFEVFRCSVRPE